MAAAPKTFPALSRPVKRGIEIGGGVSLVVSITELLDIILHWHKKITPIPWWGWLIIGLALLRWYAYSPTSDSHLAPVVSSEASATNHSQAASVVGDNASIRQSSTLEHHTHHHYGGSEIKYRPIERPDSFAADHDTFLKVQHDYPENLMIERDPAELAEIARLGTSLQVKRQIEPYIGRWMLVYGDVHDVDAFMGKYFVSLQGRGKPDVSVHLYFDESWGAEMEVLHKGDKRLVFGELERVTGSYITLQSCSILPA